MKKIIFKIFILMCVCMLLVFAISRLSLFLLQSHIKQNPILTYHISLLAGFLGLILFVVLLYVSIGRRLKKISQAVDNVSNGNLESTLKISGNDELSQLAVNFNSMIKGLQSNEYLSREFVKNVSHEFKTPVSTIIGYAQLLSSDNITQEERANYCNIITQQAKYLNQLSVNLLKISRLDSECPIDLSQRFRVDEQIRTIVLSMQPQWQQRQLQLDVQLEDIVVTANVEMYYLIWQNLISNAVKYTQQGGNIAISLKRSQEKLVFTVTNTSTSLLGNEQKAFETFYTTDISGDQRGTGLGLPLVKKVVKRLNGQITLTVTDRTIAEVHLPIKQ